MLAHHFPIKTFCLHFLNAKSLKFVYLEFKYLYFVNFDLVTKENKETGQINKERVL